MADNKVQQIIEQVEALSVLELSDLVKALEDKFGVTAAAPVMAAAPAAGGAPAGDAAPAEEQTSFTIVLKDAGANKISVIKALREINPNLGLKEAKELSEKPGSVVAENVNKATAEEAKAKLTGAGAQIEMK